MIRVARALSSLCGWIVIVLTLSVPSAAGAAGYPFADDFEDGLGNWTAVPPWGATTAFYSSPVYSATDSPSTLYAAWSDASLTLATSIDLTTATRPVLRFRHRHQIESGYDFGYVELSTDGGASWGETLATYTGNRDAWAREQLDLSPYVGEDEVRIRFRLVSDGTVNADGWYVDDVAIAEAPASVDLDPPFAVAPNSLELFWLESEEPDFLAYRIYRAAAPDIDWRTATLVAEITDVSDTGHIDITVTPKSTYHYAVMVLTVDDLHTLSNEVSASTPAGMDYPFLDDGEGTGTVWVAQGTWALSDESAFSASHAWSDSPGADYGNGIASQSLTLVSPIDLTSASSPVLSFVHDWVFASGDSGNVEISGDGGSSWTMLASYTNGSSGGWLRERFDLSAWTFFDDVLVRFRVTTNTSGAADGWHVDDISVAESPTEVTAPILDQVTSHSMRVQWTRCDDLLFSHYAVLRDTVSDVGANSTLVALIFDQDATSFTDSGLAVDTAYYYRVYAVNPYGTYSPDSATSSTQRTGGNPYPFADDFEGSLESWNLEGEWNSTDTDKHTGDRSLTDSPGTTYPDSSTTMAWTSIDLVGSSWPVLRFWDRGSFFDLGDWGYVQVSPDGATWTKLYSISGDRSTWAEQSIDLSRWKTATNLRIRFVLMPDWTNVDDGWYIDDLSIAEHLGGAVPIPFFEDFESGTGNWLTSAWASSPVSPHGGGLSALSTPGGGIKDYTEHAIELAGTLDLSAITDPQLTYWIRGGTGDNGNFRAQVSTDGGLTWPDVQGTVLGEFWTAGWTRFQVSLAAFKQSNVRLRFVHGQGLYNNGTSIFLDDVAIEEMPETVLLNVPAPHLKSVDLSWTASGLGDFDRYQVHRSTSANVTVANDLVFTSTDPEHTAFTDTGLSIGATYHYRVFVFNSRGVATPSNEKSTTTVPLNLPVVDPMENLDSWDATGTWGPDGVTPRGGSFSISDSPGGNYLDSNTSQILTAVNLVGSSWPVLRFWDRGSFFDLGDWGYVQVSPDGATWTKLYSISGDRSTWAEQSIDLSRWKTATNLRIRFVLMPDWTNVDDGWYIDDLSIAEHPGGAVPIPFFEDFESGTGNWLTSAWASSPVSPHGGGLSALSTPGGGIKDYTEHAIELAGTLDLSATTDPQLTYWIRGGTGDNGNFRAQVSTNGGLTWPDVPGTVLGEFWTAGWTRFQVSLAAFKQSNVRLRFVHGQGLYNNGTSLFLDDVAIEEMPTNVTLATPDQITISSMRLIWNDLNDPDFAAYVVYRSQNPTVSTSSELVTTVTEQTTTEFVDTQLQARTTYYYRVYFVDTNHVYSPSNTVSGTTIGVTMPFSDDFETDSGVWTLTGGWGRITDAGVGGSTSLGDSPADLAPNVDTWAVTGVDLSGTAWPVLAFSDRFDIPADHWGRLEISSNAGGSWTTLYGIQGSQPEWVSRRFDLSPWRNQTQVWIRFRLVAWGSAPGDGWHIDDVFISENPVAGSSVYPVFDGLEGGAGAWLNGQWATTADAPYEGSTAILSTAGIRLGGSENWLILGDELDLSATDEPLLTYQVRGNLPYRAYFRVDLSADGGLTWQEQSALNLNEYWVSSDWVRKQLPLSSYKVANLRLRFRITGNGGGAEDIFLDNISVGEQTPAAPTLNAPAWGHSEPTVRPTLIVNNAIEYQSDPLDYHFQVYDDPDLTSFVAEVPAVAGGTDTTSWTVDVDLQPDTQYWWRCRATDDSGHTGTWMEAATFYVQLTDHPPTVPVLVGPSAGGQLPDLTGRLAWLECTDPDEDNGDSVVGYRVQVDDDPAFASPEVDDASITPLAKATGAISVSLAELSGSGNLVLGTRYYWRANARDSHGGTSAWSDGPAHFVFGTDTTAPSCTIVAPTDDATVTATPITISGTATDDLAGVDFVEVSTDGGETWEQVVGDEAWLHQWWPAASGDYELSCRATDLAANTGDPSTPITVHADLDRTMAFAQASATVDESVGTFNVTVTLSAARAVEVTAELIVSGTAQSGSDFEAPPELVRFFPGQTTLVFPVAIIDDAQSEGDETLILQLANANLPEVSFGAYDSLTLTIVDNDVLVDPGIFSDGFEDGNAQKWSAVVGLQ